ncbi:MAG: glycosyltransferase family 4 protein [bacterium]
MRVLVDGIIYRLQKVGGISRCFSEQLIRIGNYCSDVKVILHLPPQCHAPVPEAKWIYHIKDLNPRIGSTKLNTISMALSKARAWTLRPQIFHSTYYRLPYWSNLINIVTVHDFIYEKFSALFMNAHDFIQQKRCVIEKADALIAVSSSTKADILNYTNAKESSITVINNSVSDTFLTNPPTKEDIHYFLKKYTIDNIYWLYIGNRCLYKNFGTFLKAFIRIAPNTEGYLVAIGGEDTFESWQIDMIIKSRLEKRIHLFPALNDFELKIIYSGAAAFVAPSIAEGFGIPLLEAMACGTPVLASDIPVFREIAGDAALFFDPYDEEALAEAMGRVLKDPIKHDLITKGKKQVKKFSWDFSTQQLVNVYQSFF